MIRCSFFVSLFLLLTLSANVYGAPRKKSSAKTNQTTSSGVNIRPNLRSDRRAVIINFSNLGSADSSSCSLTYLSNGKEEGASATVRSSSGSNGSRELVFGTASAGVYKYHTNIQNARLSCLTKLKNGQQIRKSFRIKL